MSWQSYCLCLCGRISETWPTHTHILLILAPEDKIHSFEKYDSIVSAEIPDPAVYPLAYETVITTMMHGPCGILNPSSPCIKDGKCQKHYPKNFQQSTEEVIMD